jgi:hypothetical protein
MKQGPGIRVGAVTEASDSSDGSLGRIVSIHAPMKMRQEH